MHDSCVSLGVGRSGCGYCRASGDTFVAEGAIARWLAPAAYQRLLDARWRRSGNYLYRPVLEATCCRLQTIRLDCVRFQMSKSQRKALSALLHHASIPAPKDNDRQAFLDAVLSGLTEPPKPTPTPTPAFRWSLEPARYSEASFEVYRSYQQAVHGDDPQSLTRDAFEAFFCTSPLQTSAGIGAAVGGRELALGSSHLHLYMDGRLAAVSVIDILPACISSVYFFYDPAYRRLSLGTVSALLEIGLVRRIRQCVPGLHYYYLGYYLGECAKMAYKARFAPSELLDPETLLWEELK